MFDQVVILDTTLRVHDPSAGIDFSLTDKLDIAVELAKLRVDVIEVGRPAASPVQQEAVRRIAQEVRSCRISALARCDPAEIEIAAAALKGASEGRLHVYLSHSPTQNPSETIGTAASMVRMARNLVADVEFSLQDATRSDPAFFADLVRSALSAGATTINVPDIGFILPDELAARIGRVRREVPELEGAVLSFHGHDDLGVATANAIAAVRAGARQIEVAVNGLGGAERNTSLEEVVTALRVHADLLRVVTRFDTTGISSLCKLVEDRTGIGAPANRWRHVGA